MVGAAFGILSACGGRSDVMECDGEVGQRDGESVCVVSEPSDFAIEEEEEQDMMPPPSSMSPDMKMEYDMTSLDMHSPVAPVEPGPEVERARGVYRTDERGYPVPWHPGSFEQIVNTASRVCVVDEHSDLYCWDITPQDDAPNERPGTISPLYEGVAEALADVHGRPCVLHEDRHRVECLNRSDVWQNVMTTRGQYTRLSADDSGVLCVLDEGSRQPFCQHLLTQGEQGYTTTPTEWFFHRQAYAFFDARNLTSDHRTTHRFVAINAHGTLEFGHFAIPSRSSSWLDIVSSTGAPFEQVYQRSGYIAALVEGRVELYSANTEDDYVLLESPDEMFEQLYSTNCGLTPDREVLCWHRDPRLPNPDISMPTWSVYNASAARSVSLREGTLCAISQASTITCQNI